MITKQLVEKILKSHGYTLNELIQDLGDSAMYSKKQVLTWMGY